MAERTTNKSVAEDLLFNQLCMFFERVQKAKNNNLRKKEFQTFRNKWTDLEASSTQGSSFYAAFRLISPQLDKDRPAYGVKEALLAKLYIEVLGLSPTGQDAVRLLKYRAPKTNSASTGDFAEVAYHHVLSKRCIAKGSLTIGKINELLDELASCNAKSKKDMMKKTLMKMIKQTSAIEQKWLIRIMLKDTKLRLGQKVLLNEFHEDAEDLYNVTTSLKIVCEKLKDPNVRLADTQIALFQPFKPMLAQNIKIDQVEKIMQHQEFQVEIKYDGERSQLHKDGNTYKYFSRNGKEYSTVFGESSYGGTLTQYIHSSFSPDVKSCILDGEMMGFDPDLNIFMQKGAKFDIKHITEESALQPCFVAFDLLLLNGERLTSRKQIDRFEILRKIIQPVAGRIILAEGRCGSKNEHVVQFLNEAIDRREEGIIVKNPHSSYFPNQRKDSGWFKVKPEYVDGVVDDLDLVVVGGSFGTGRRANFLSMFHVAVGVKDPDNRDKPPEVFKSFCRIGSGYTNAELLQITEKLKPNLKVFEKKKVPSWLKLTKEKPDVTVHPKDSVVVQVRASEIIPSSAYAAGCTLRFPRLVGVRDDKEWTDALDEEQLDDLKQTADGKLAARHASLSKQQQAPPPKRRKVIAQPSIATSFKGVDAATVEQISTSFENKVFCVINGTPEYGKQNLEKRILENGGSIVQNPTADLWCAVARTEENIRVRNLIRANKYDVLSADWLIRCLEKGSLLPWKPTELIHATQRTKEQMAETYDRFGDHFAENVDVSSLGDIFSRITPSALSSVLPAEDAPHRDRALQTFVNRTYARYPTRGFHDSPTSLFQGLTFHLLNSHSDRASSAVIEAKDERIKSLIKFYSGILIDSLKDDAISHVVIPHESKTSTSLRSIMEGRRARKRKFRIVTCEWVNESVKQLKLLDEIHYNVVIDD